MQLKKGDMITSPCGTYRALVLENLTDSEMYPEGSGINRVSLYVLHDEICPYNKHTEQTHILPNVHIWTIQGASPEQEVPYGT